MLKLCAIVCLCYAVMVCQVHSHVFSSTWEFQNELDYVWRQTVMAKFLLYTNKNSTYPTLVNIGDVTALEINGYNSSLPTKFIIHGWRDSIHGETSVRIRPAFLERMQCNIFFVDWKKASYVLYVIAATKNVYIVGEEVARFIEFLMKHTGLELRNIHLIGHSLGSHIAGWASRNIIYGKVPRITGLDVALPLFNLVQRDKRLSPESAEFVEVFHTNGGILGFKSTLGHVDFFINNGRSQPGCFTIICSHLRVNAVYGEIISGISVFTAKPCRTETEVTKNQCSEMAPSISLSGVLPPADMPSKIYRFDTSDSSPFSSINMKMLL